MKEEEMKIKAGKPYEELTTEEKGFDCRFHRGRAYGTETEIRKTPEACHRTGGRG